jgi:hypothetical protein
VLVDTAPPPLPTVRPEIDASTVSVAVPVTPKVVDAVIEVAATVLGVVAPKVPLSAPPVIVGLVRVLFVRVSVVALPTKVSVDVGRVRVPVLEIVLITGVVRVLFVNVSVPVKVAIVLETAGTFKLKVDAVFGPTKLT